MRLGCIHILLLTLVMILQSPGVALAAVDEPEDLLPGDNVVGLWRMNDDGLYFYEYSLDRVIDEEMADIVLEYGFVSLFSRFYMQDLNEIECRVFEMENAEQAFGLYSILADILPDVEEIEFLFEGEGLKLGRSSTPEMRWYGTNELQLLGDNYVIQIIGDTEGLDFEFLSFAVKIQAKFDVSGGDLGDPYPLDRDDKIAGSQKLIGGYNTLELYMMVGNFDPFLIYEDGVRCIMGDYRLSPGEYFRQIVVEYPDEELAKEGFAAFKNWIDGFYYLRRKKVIDALGSYYAVNEKDKYMGGFMDGKYLRVFYGFNELDDLKDIISDYR